MPRRGRRIGPTSLAADRGVGHNAQRPSPVGTTEIKPMRLRDRIIEVLYRSATGQNRLKGVMTIVAPVTFLSLFALIIFLLLRLDAAIGLHIPVPGPWHAVIGIVLVAIGIVPVVWAFFTFLAAHGTPVPFNPPPTLVTTGPFAYTRNPMFAGVIVQLVGIGLWLRSWSTVLLFVPLLAVFFCWALRNIEEPELERRLGDKYRTYKARVPMFIPRLRR